MRLCIKLDNPYVKYKKSNIKTERFINELFEELGISLIRIKIDADYNFIYLENKLREIISKPAYNY